MISYRVGISLAPEETNRDFPFIGGNRATRYCCHLCCAIPNGEGNPTIRQIPDDEKVTYQDLGTGPRLNRLQIDSISVGCPDRVLLGPETKPESDHCIKGSVHEADKCPSNQSPATPALSKAIAPSAGGHKSK